MLAVAGLDGLELGAMGFGREEEEGRKGPRKSDEAEPSDQWNAPKKKGRSFREEGLNDSDPLPMSKLSCRDENRSS